MDDATRQIIDLIVCPIREDVSEIRAAVTKINDRLNDQEKKVAVIMAALGVVSTGAGVLIERILHL